MATKLFVSDSDSFEDRGVIVTVDFGTSNTTASTTVTGCPWVTAVTRFVGCIAGETSDHPSVEDALLEQISFVVGNKVVGVGFDVIAAAPNGTHGTYTFHVAGV